jgi:predicted MPP superfamily phosphohydrolase
MYFLAAKRDWPQYKNVLVTLDYLQRKPVTVALTDNHAKKGMRKIQGLWRKIKHDSKPYRHKDPIWVCKSFCDREKCDKYWSLFQKAGGDIDEFREYMRNEIEQEKNQRDPEE